MRQVDYLIVGQGVAGTLLAYFLQQAGKQIQLVDQYSEQAASQVAAGIINPITGRRYVKSWKADELLPFAKQTYRALEDMLGLTIFRQRNIIRTLFNHREENDWLARTADPAYQPYMLEQAVLDNYATSTLLAFGYGEVTHSGQADLQGLTHAFREKLRQENALTEAVMAYEELAINAQYVRWRDIEARGVVFCEGAAGSSNPYFSYLPFGGAKGEVLIVRIPKVKFEKILKHRVFIVPMPAPDHYWIGSTYDWKYEDARPTERGRQYLEQRLRDMLQTPFEIVEHRAAIRPTVKDRRPFLGQHPDFEPLYIFNGLGTKGASLGPYWACHMANYLAARHPLDPEVDIARFGEA